MQTSSGQNTAGASTPTKKIISTVLILFSVGGLIIGFAIGGFTRPQATQTGNTGPTKKPTVVVQTTTTVTPTPTPPPVIYLGFPQFITYPTATESASGGNYTVDMQALDKSKKPVRSPDITCKLWLVQQIPAKQSLSIDTKTLKDVTNLAQPIEGTINHQPAPELPYLTFTGSTKQTTNCDADGKASWQYQIAPTAVPGDYSLVILTDWKGQHYNWYWANITIA